MKEKLARVIARYRLTDPSALLHALERTEDRVHIARHTSGIKHTLRGVPAKHVDVVVTDDVTEPRHPDDVLVLEHVEKQGKYDGAVRDRWLVRRMRRHQTTEFPRVDVWVHFEESRAVVELRGVEQSHEYPRLKESLDGHLPARIVMWHWRRYYKHLTDEDAVRAMADAFEPTPGSTLAEANRQASRLLYRLSRELGWAKLSRRERERFGKPDASVWQRVEDVDRWRELQAVSDYTLEAASGETVLKR